jgi:hypothetical protein
MLSVYHDFRLFYNQNIHPELMHLEQRRRRLIRLMWLAGFMLLAIIILQAFIRIFVVTLVLLVPVGLGIAYLAFRIQVFFQEFKPRIVGLVLDFIDNDINYSFTTYQPKGSISRAQFLASRIFTSADDFAGEELIKGQVRETPFEMSELRVLEFSPVRDRLDRVFKGIFLIGDFRRWDMQGGVLVLPDAYRKYLLRSAKQFHLMGGRRVRQQLLPEFEAFFDTYATPDVQISEIVSTDLQWAILEFRERFAKVNRDKDIYFSIIGDKIYLALTQDRDLLEPSLFRNNVRFDLVNEFYEDLRLLLDVVRDVDVMN